MTTVQFNSIDLFQGAVYSDMPFFCLWASLVGNATAERLLLYFYFFKIQSLVFPYT